MDGSGSGAAGDSGRVEAALQLAETSPPGRAGEGAEPVRRLLRRGAEILGCGKASIWTGNGTDGALNCLAGLDGEESRLRRFRLNPGEGAAGRAAVSRRPVVIDDAAATPAHSKEADAILSVTTANLISLPLLAGGVSLGAVNFLNRPPGSPPASKEILWAGRLLAHALARRLLESGLHFPRNGEAPPAAPETGSRPARAVPRGFQSPGMRGLLEQIGRSGSRSILIQGETGAGKDFLARWIHQTGPVPEGPFVTVNCAAIPEAVWESEVFGHARGAFTGAVRDRPGHIEAAEGGTLFLNEIGEMSPMLQAKLLTFLDSGEYRRIGETRVRPSRTRIIAATNRDMREEMRRGNFRPDLYHRLAQVVLRIPPLRDRPGDLAELAAERAGQTALARGAGGVRLTDEAVALLAAGRWSGNARELFNAVDNAVVEAIELGLEAVPAALFAGSAETPSGGEGRREGSAPEFPGESLLREILERTRTRSTGRFNWTAVHRELFESGRVAVSRPVFVREARKRLGMED